MHTIVIVHQWGGAEVGLPSRLGELSMALRVCNELVFRTGQQPSPAAVAHMPNAQRC